MSVRIEWAIPCRYAETGPGGGTIVGAGSSVARIDEFPALLVVKVYANIVAADADCEAPVVLEALMHGPNLQPVGEPVTVSVAMGERNPLLPDGWEQRRPVIFDVQHAADAPGVYMLEVIPNGDRDRGAVLHFLALEGGGDAEA